MTAISYRVWDIDKRLEKGGWKFVSLGDLLEKHSEPAEINPTKIYKEITVHLWGQGVSLRGEKAGSEIRATKRYVAHKGQFIFSRIDARNGAFGIIPEELDGAVVSTDFPVHHTKENKLLPSYLGWLSRIPSFVDACRTVSEGTTNRVRLKEDKFYRIEIPLPPLSEQRRIVAIIERLAGKVEEAKHNRIKSINRVERLQKSLLQRFEANAYENGSTKSISSIIRSHDSGWSPRCLNIPASEGTWGILKTTAVQWNEFVPLENKAIGIDLEPREEKVVSDGDVLITRAGPTNRVGISCVVRNPPEKLMLSDKIIRLVPSDEIFPEYLALILISPNVQEYFRQGKTGLATSQVNITRKKILSLKIQVPPIQEQRRLVDSFKNFHTKVNSLKALQAKTVAELDAMLPSILDRAFKGEL